MKMALRVASVLAIVLVAVAARAQETPAPAGDATPAAAAPEATVAETAAPAAEDTKANQEVPQSVAVLTGETSTTERAFPLGGIVILEQLLGLGTFVDDPNARVPYYGWSLSLRPKYYITSQLTVEARFDISQELTTSSQTSTTKPRQVMPSDTFVTVRYQNAYKGEYTWDIGISPFIRIGAPSSYQSRDRNLYLSLAAGFDLSRMFGEHVYLSYTFRYTKNFNGLPGQSVGSDVALIRTHGSEAVGSGEVFTGEPAVSMSVYNSLLASFIINAEWSISLQLGILNAWNYALGPSTADQYTSEYAKTSSNGLFHGSDKTYGTLDVTYQPWEHVGFSLGISSIQPAKTADGSGFRFPFFDFRSAPNNYTNFYFDIYATF
jgi:hypothetical protein